MEEEKTAIEHEKTFYLHGGKTLNSIKGLAKELANMPKEIYEKHVNHEKNDFSLWIKHSLKEEDLSKQIDGHLELIEMELKVLRHLVHNIEENKVETKKVSNSSKKSDSNKKKEISSIKKDENLDLNNNKNTKSTRTTRSTSTNKK